MSLSATNFVFFTAKYTIRSSNDQPIIPEEERGNWQLLGLDHHDHLVDETSCLQDVVKILTKMSPKVVLSVCIPKITQIYGARALKCVPPLTPCHFVLSL